MPPTIFNSPPTPHSIVVIYGYCPTGVSSAGVTGIYVPVRVDASGRLVTTT